MAQTRPPVAPVSIDQGFITEQLDTFLRAQMITDVEDESFPSWMQTKNHDLVFSLCNAFALMALRAGFLGEEKKFYDRLEMLARSDSDHIYAMGKLYNTYQKLYSEQLSLEAKKLEHEIAECKGGREKIAAVREQHFAAVNKQIKERFIDSALALIEAGEDLYIFIQSLLFVQNPNEYYSYQYNNQVVEQDDFKAMMAVVAPDSKKLPTPTYSFSFGFQKNNSGGQDNKDDPENSNELCDVLSHIITKDSFVLLSTSDHSMYVRMAEDEKGEKRYVLYDSNNMARPIPVDLKQLTAKIIKQFFTDFCACVRKGPYCECTDALPVSIKIFERGNPVVKRPEPEQLYNMLLDQRKTKRFHPADPLNLNAAGPDGFGALHIAVYARDKQLVKRLLQYPEIDVNAKTNSGMTVLHMAISSNRLDLVEMLVIAGADVNAVTSAGVSVLEMAIAGDNYTLIRLLLSAGANDNVVDSTGKLLSSQLKHFNFVERITFQHLQHYLFLEDSQKDNEADAKAACEVKQASPNAKETLLIKRFFYPYAKTDKFRIFLEEVGAESLNNAVYADPKLKVKDNWAFTQTKKSDTKLDEFESKYHLLGDEKTKFQQKHANCLLKYISYANFLLK